MIYRGEARFPYIQEFDFDLKEELRKLKLFDAFELRINPSFIDDGRKWIIHVLAGSMRRPQEDWGFLTCIKIFFAIKKDIFDIQDTLEGFCDAVKDETVNPLFIHPKRLFKLYNQENIFWETSLFESPSPEKEVHYVVCHKSDMAYNMDHFLTSWFLLNDVKALLIYLLLVATAVHKVCEIGKREIGLYY